MARRQYIRKGFGFDNVNLMRGRGVGPPASGGPTPRETRF
jgi:hypothetical protein